jgi:hypothetical protein
MKHDISSKLRSSPLAMLAAGACAIASVACSSSSSGGGAGGDSPTGEPIAFAAPGDYGTISVGSFGSGANASHLVTGEFHTDTPACTTKVIGACTLVTCDAARRGIRSLFNAGTIDITGGATALKIAPDAEGLYPTSAVPGAEFKGGEHLDVATTGGDVPAFRASVVAPLAVTIQSGVGTSGTTHDVSTPLTIGWTGSSDGFVSVLVTSMNLDAQMQCFAPVAAGSLVIEPQAMTALRGTTSVAQLNQYVRTRVVAGNWNVDVMATTIPSAPGTQGGGWTIDWK